MRDGSRNDAEIFGSLSRPDSLLSESGIMFTTVTSMTAPPFWCASVGGVRLLAHDEPPYPLELLRWLEIERIERRQAGKPKHRPAFFGLVALQNPHAGLFRFEFRRVDPHFIA